MKFLADMGISPKSVLYLRQLHYEAVHLHDLGLERLADADIFKKAYHEGYIILTHDLDFGDLLAASSLRAPYQSLIR